MSIVERHRKQINFNTDLNSNNGVHNSKVTYSTDFVGDEGFHNSKLLEYFVVGNSNESTIYGIIESSQTSAHCKRLATLAAHCDSLLYTSYALHETNLESKQQI